MRKIVLTLLIAGLCIGLIGTVSSLALEANYYELKDYETLTGKKLEFHEAPMLRVKVATGELPPVEERLPEEPVVVKPLGNVGQYGGALRVAAQSPVSGVDSAHTRIQHLLRLAPDLSTVMPDIAKGWDFSEDLKTLTVYLRKGLKWSDGASFTAEDIMFWYEDVLLNDEITPAKPWYWNVGGKLVKAKKIDDYTVAFETVIPNPWIVNELTRFAGEPFLPKHYLKKYHIRYNAKANELAKKEGYEEWWQCFNWHSKTGMGQQDVNLPTLNPWFLKEITTEGNKYFERNPYYYKVDISGNQLPYIDEQINIIVPDKEVLELKAISGEFDLVGAEVALSLKSYSLYKENEKKGHYRTLMWQDPSVAASYNFNMTHKDPVLRKIFNDLRFRQAMSLAINREEISKVLYFGEAVPHQGIVEPGCSFYEDWMGKYYTEYDPERANTLLDEMGLKWDKDHKYRLRPDGKVLTITLEYAPITKYEKIGALVGEYWGKVGLKVVLKEVSTSLWIQRGNSNDRDVGAWHVVGRSHLLFQPPWNLAPLSSSGVPWAQWHDSGGKTGEEPPQIIKDLFKLVDEWRTTVPGSKEYIELGKKVLGINVKNLFSIGTVGLIPTPLIVRDNLKNIPEKAVWSPAFWHWLPYQADQWYFEK